MSVIDFSDDTTAPVSLTSRAKLRYNNTTKIFEVSIDGAAYVPLLSTSVPGAHAATHVNGTDDIQLATNGQKGLASAAQITTLEAATLNTDAALTGNAYFKNDPLFGSPDTTKVTSESAIKSFVDQSVADIPDATAAQKGLATPAQITKLDAISGTNTGDEPSFTGKGNGNGVVADPGGSPSGQFLKDDGTFDTPGGGDVTGPGSAVADNVATFSGTTGKIIKDSGLALSGSNTGDEVDATTSVKGIVELATDGEDAANVAVQGNDARLSNGRGVVATWTFDPSTVMADPGAGDIRYNNATPGSITEVTFSVLANGGAAMADYFNLLKAGDVVTLGQADAPGSFLVGVITDPPPFDGTTHWTITLSSVAALVLPTTGSDIVLTVIQADLNLVDSGSTSVAEDVDVILSTFFIDDSLVPALRVGLADNVSFLIRQGQTTASPDTDSAVYSLVKTTTNDQYEMHIRHKDGGAAARTFTWKITAG